MGRDLLEAVVLHSEFTAEVGKLVGGDAPVGNLDGREVDGLVSHHHLALELKHALFHSLHEVEGNALGVLAALEGNDPVVGLDLLALVDDRLAGTLTFGIDDDRGEDHHGVGLEVT